MTPHHLGHVLEAHGIGGIALSIAVAIVGSWAALDLFGRLRNLVGAPQWLWPAAPAAAMGLAIWTMHFTAMLSSGMASTYRGAYNPVGTLVSLLIAVAATMLSFTVVARVRAEARRYPILISGLAMGLGICAMHYAGMAALMTAEVVQVNDPGIVGLAVCLAVIASTSALNVGLNQTAKGSKARAAVIFGLAVAGTHYLAMTGVHFIQPSAGREFQKAVQGIDPLHLAYMVGGASVLLFVVGAIGPGADRVLRVVVRARTIRAYEARMRALADRLPVGLVFVATDDIKANWVNRLAKTTLGLDGAVRMARTVIQAENAEWIHRFVWSGPKGPQRLEACVAKLPASILPGRQGQIVAFRDVSDLAACEDDVRRSWHSHQAKPQPDDIARDIGSMLQAIGMAMGTLHGNGPRVDELAPARAERLMRQAAERGESIVQALTAPVERPAAQAEPIDLTSWLLGDARELIMDSAGHGIGVELRAQDGLRPIMASLEGLEGAVMAIAASEGSEMKEGGMLELEARSLKLAPGDDRDGLSGNFVSLSFEGRDAHVRDGDPRILHAVEFARNTGGATRVESIGGQSKVTLLLPVAEG